MQFLDDVEKFERESLWEKIYDYVIQESTYSFRSYTLKDGCSLGNVCLNRYQDILPYDYCRVKLKRPNADNTDYINASLVSLPDHRHYIATQGPMPHTTSHFWQMVWEQNVYMVIMLNKIVERNDCRIYWPTTPNLPQIYGDYCLTLVSENDNRIYSLRKFKLSRVTNSNKEKESVRTIMHLHYTNWPDFGVPDSFDDFLRFQADSKKIVLDRETETREVAPVVVHCSAGVGRTGVFILVDLCLAEIRDGHNLEDFNPMYTLTDMRGYRPALIQTSEQLRFAFLSILRGIEVYHPLTYEELKRTSKRRNKMSDSIISSYDNAGQAVLSAATLDSACRGMRVGASLGSTSMVPLQPNLLSSHLSVPRVAPISPNSSKNSPVNTSNHSEAE